MFSSTGLVLNMNESTYLQLSGDDRMLHQGKFTIPMRMVMDNGPDSKAIFSVITPLTGGPEFGDGLLLHFYGISHLFRKLSKGEHLPYYTLSIEDGLVVAVEGSDPDA
jgi:hypothetical protein